MTAFFKDLSDGSKFSWSAPQRKFRVIQTVTCAGPPDEVSTVSEVFGDFDDLETAVNAMIKQLDVLFITQPPVRRGPIGDYARLQLNFNGEGWIGSLFVEDGKKKFALSCNEQAIKDRPHLSEEYKRSNIFPTDNVVEIFKNSSPLYYSPSLY